MHTFPITLVKFKFVRRLHKTFNLKYPKSFKEKNQWMKFNINTLLIERIADKFKLRDYLKEKGLEKHIIPLLGIYTSYDQITTTPIHY